MIETTHEAPADAGKPVTREPARNREEVLAILRACQEELQALGATSLHLYGSAARDELKSDSDVDIYVDYDPDGPFSFVEFLEIKNLVSNRLQRDVDLATRRGLNPRLRSRIERTSLQVF
jgi:predicted nucleotidyltransferase